MADEKNEIKYELMDISKQLDDTEKTLKSKTSGWGNIAKSAANAVGKAFLSVCKTIGDFKTQLDDLKIIDEKQLDDAGKTLNSKTSGWGKIAEAASDVVKKAFLSVGKTIGSFVMRQESVKIIDEKQLDDAEKTIKSKTSGWGDISLVSKKEDSKIIDEKQLDDAEKTLKSKTSGWGDIAKSAGGAVGKAFLSVGKTIGGFVMQQEEVKMQFDSLAGEMGQTLSPVLSDAMQQFGDLVLNNKDVKEGLTQLFTAIAQIAQEALPLIIDAFSQFLPMLIQMAIDLMPIIVNLITILLPIIMQIIETVLPVLIEVIQLLLPPLLQIIQTIMPVILELIQALMPLLSAVFEIVKPILDLVIALLQPILNIITGALGPLISIITFLIEQAIVPLQTYIGILQEYWSSIFTSIADFTMSQFERIKNIFFGIIDFVKNIFTGNWQGAWDAVKEIFSNIWDGIKAAVVFPFNFIIDGINGFIKGLNKIKVPDWVPGIGGAGINIPLIPRLQKGEDEIMSDWTLAYLDKGERVLTREQNVKFKSIGGLAGMEQLLSGNLAMNMGGQAPFTIVVSSPLYMDGTMISKSVTQHQYDDIMTRRTR